MKTILKNRTLNILIKLLVFILLAWVIYQQVFEKDKIDEIWALFTKSLERQHVHFLILAILLMPVNWVFETLKWRVLIEKIESLTFAKSFIAILAGVTLSLFTPNRIGEYGGRVLFVKAENNWKVVIATLVGSFSQLLIILSMGIIGLSYFIHHLIELDPYLTRGVIVLMMALVALMFFCFYNIEQVIPIARKIPLIIRFKRFFKHVKVLKDYNSRTLSKALRFAMLRYSVYSLQYFLLLQYFGIEVSFLDGITGIATIFLLQTSIPLPPLLGLVMRGEIAILVWQSFGADELNILAATFVLWVLNLIVPALAGILFIAHTDVLKSLGYGKEEIKPNR